jgi:hypothetical protein
VARRVAREPSAAIESTIAALFIALQSAERVPLGLAHIGL